MSRAYEAATPGGGWRGLVSWLVEPIGLEDVVVGGQYKWAAGDRGRGGRVCRLPSSAWNLGLCPPTWSPRQLRVIGAGAVGPVLAESRAEGEIAHREPALPHELLTWVG